MISFIKEYIKKCFTPETSKLRQDLPSTTSNEVPIFETRVRHFYDHAYVAEYLKNGNWYEFKKPLFYVFDDYCNDVRNSKYHPYIGSFDECVNFCKTIKTLEDVETYHKDRFDKWDIEYSKMLERKKNIENKTWSSTD